MIWLHDLLSRCRRVADHLRRIGRRLRFIARRTWLHYNNGLYRQGNRYLCRVARRLRYVLRQALRHALLAVGYAIRRLSVAGMRRGARLAAAGFALAVTLACGLAAWQWSVPLHAPRLYPLYEADYQRSIAATGVRRLELARLALSDAPDRADAWLLQAYALQSLDGHVTPRVAEALRRSYAIAALSPAAHDWRTVYLYSIWSQLPADLRRDLSHETAVYLDAPHGMETLSSLAPRIPDAGGRLALGIAVFRKQMQMRADFLHMRNEFAPLSERSQTQY